MVQQHKRYICQLVIGERLQHKTCGHVHRSATKAFRCAERLNQKRKELGLRGQEFVPVEFVGPVSPLAQEYRTGEVCTRAGGRRFEWRPTHADFPRIM